MLLDLKIKNFVIIEDLAISFGRGLNILTGETGAGKSILIDALSGVLGEKMTTDMIRTGFEKSTLEASFDIAAAPQVRRMLEDSGIDCDDDTLLLRRELYASGKGRSFANAVQIPASKLKELSEYLIDIHGQNEHQNIVKVSRHRELLDSFGNLEGEVARVRSIHERLQKLKDSINSFDIDEREKARRIEFNSFAVREIEAAKLKTGEEEELKNESTLLANAEKLFKEITSASQNMSGDGGIIQKLKVSEQALSKISEYDPEISGILDTIKQALYSLEDASDYLRGYRTHIDFTPERINQVEERLSLLASFKKKYGDSIQDILNYAEKARAEMEAISSGEEQREKLKTEYRQAVKEAKEVALRLSESRKETARTLESRVMKELADLGMSGTIFKVSIQREINPQGEIEADNKRYMLYPHGLDRIEFLLSANAGEDLRQLRKVASGGEMSRIMLAIKNVILSADIVDSLVFDEVDAGIGGKVAEIVGRKLKSLAKNRQVLVVTHLPQIAAMSDSHYSVQKGKSGERITTLVKQLNLKDKIREIARMLAGETVTDLSMKHAEEMVRNAERSGPA
ncbi:MAG TPA: DNA repair protein RecN [Spirochaetota bacterium]|mgnify:CR=1 FL=1|nr:DNA repair protein RecN [Spirochaetota bacterium]HOD13408.1 DNA repair protein RecN [Spirochaetota bacterium]HPG50289.1 DNA repair protein RecN [Spirochaetota bacterium]HPN12521.1 DNA repair protein RecN [Spirochaetota bacterium]HQL82173.1 DNA repair protein RecN [Spirochaetota bacterium]